MLRVVLQEKIKTKKIPEMQIVALMDLYWTNSVSIWSELFTAVVIEPRKPHHAERD